MHQFRAVFLKLRFSIESSENLLKNTLRGSCRTYQIKIFRDPKERSLELATLTNILGKSYGEANFLTTAQKNHYYRLGSWTFNISCLSNKASCYHVGKWSQSTFHKIQQLSEVGLRHRVKWQVGCHILIRLQQSLKDQDNKYDEFLQGTYSKEEDQANFIFKQYLKIYVYTYNLQCLYQLIVKNNGARITPTIIIFFLIPQNKSQGICTVTYTEISLQH